MSSNKLLKTKRNQNDKKVTIYPSPTYLYLLLAASEILESVVEEDSAEKTSSLNLRVQEIRSLLVALNPSVNLEQLNIIETIAALTPIKIEELNKNF